MLPGTYQRPLALGNDLDTLRSAVCPLVELPGKILHRKNDRAGEIRVF